MPCRYQSSYYDMITMFIGDGTSVTGGLAVLLQSTVQLKKTGMKGSPCANKQLTQLTVQKTSCLAALVGI